MPHLALYSHKVSRTGRLQAARSGSKARLQRTSARPPRQRPPRRSQLPRKNTNMQRAPASPSETHISYETDSGRSTTGRRQRLSAVPLRPCCMLHVATKAGLFAHTVAVVDCACESDAQTDVIHALPRLPPPRLLVGLRREVWHALSAQPDGVRRSHAPVTPSMVPLRPQRAGRRADADA